MVPRGVEAYIEAQGLYIGHASSPTEAHHERREADGTKTP